MHAVEFRDVSKYFALDSQRPSSFQETLINAFRKQSDSSEPGLWALRDVSFAIEPGESVAFIGVNGSGKSTVLKLISRVFTPTTGAVAVKGRVTALLELGAGFHPELTGRENIALNGSILGLGRASIRQQFDEIVAFSELGRFIDVPVRSYSSGMLMRLGFAVATAFQPDILLIDEVLAVGDQAFQDRCLHRIAQIKHRGATIVLVSHDLESVRRLCVRAIWLHQGKLLGDGPTAQVTSRYLTRLWSESTSLGADEEQHEPDTERAAHAGVIPDEQSVAESAQLPGPEHAETEPQAGLSTGGRETPARWGSGEVRIEKVELFDGAGEPTRVFQTGGLFKVRMWYNAAQRIERPAFGISIYDEQGNRINGPNTEWAEPRGPDGLETSIEVIQERGLVEYTADRFPLLPGRYDLTVAVYDEFVVHPYDHWHRMLTFTVIPGDVERQDGLCYIPCRWNHKRSAADAAGPPLPESRAPGAVGEGVG
jgi:homopolymeric O-antigen transport system ATP-binding protein